MSNKVFEARKDWHTEVSLGRVEFYSSINKFGAAPAGIQTTLTDIWDRADATPTQQIWTAPTAARVHAIVSSSTADASGSTGALTVKLYGLTSWTSDEVSETITLTGQTPVNTTNSYVIIHRMEAFGQSTTTAVGVNVGTITATAATDGTVTAAILPGNGQTEMAIYGVPSTKTALLYRWSCQIDKQATPVQVDFTLKVNTEPDTQRVGFKRKGDISLMSTGTTSFEKHYTCPLKFEGPCIIKIQALASTADTDAEADFDLILVSK